MTITNLDPEDCTEAIDDATRFGEGPQGPPSTSSRSAPLPEDQRRPHQGPRYRLKAPIGRGGMGEVLRAQDEKLSRDVALKKVRTDCDDEAIARFTAEARIGGQLDHPAVLPVYDFDYDEGGVPYFTMKLVPGHQSLADIIAGLRRGDEAVLAAWSFPRRVALVQQVCRAVAHAHKRGVVHRDLKPSNIVLTSQGGRDGEVYVVDWGIAKLMHGPQEEAEPIQMPDSVRAALRRLDETSLVGTPAYMAPEQLAEGAADERTDTWSLCVILYELLTLHHPLGEARSPADVRAALAQLPFTEAERFKDPAWGRVPRSLSRILWHGLHKERAERFSGPDHLERALQAWVEGSSPIVCPSTLLQRILRRAHYLLDQHTILGPTLVLGLFCGFLVWLVDVAWKVVDMAMP